MIERIDNGSSGYYESELRYAREDIDRIGKEVERLGILLRQQKEDLEKARIQDPNNTTRHTRLAEQIRKSDGDYQAS